MQWIGRNYVRTCSNSSFPPAPARGGQILICDMEYMLPLTIPPVWLTYHIVLFGSPPDPKVHLS